MTCGRSLKTVRNNPGAAVVYPVAANLQAGIHRSKMAVFDIDDTLFDASQREINARRAGLAPSTPYTGDRKPSEYPKGKKAFMDFFNSPKQFRIDPIIPGALDHVRTLVRDGYTIAYLTGRPHAYFNATMEHLKEKGFPVFNDGNGQPLLFMKPNKKKKTAEFKYNVMRNLQGKFDIHYFYDDLKENRDMAFKLGVIGVYDLRDRLGVRDNPAPNCGCGQTPCKTYGSRSNPTYQQDAIASQGTPSLGPFSYQQAINVAQGIQRDGQDAYMWTVRLTPYGYMVSKSQPSRDYLLLSHADSIVKHYPASRSNPGGYGPKWEIGSSYDLAPTDYADRGVFMPSPEGQAAAYARRQKKIDDKREKVKMVKCKRCNQKEFADAIDDRGVCRKCVHAENRDDTKGEVHKVIGGIPFDKAGNMLLNPPGYREAAGCIVQRGSDKKILLLRRSIHETSFHGMYELPGGKLEEGETPKEAALIETKEEAGLDVRIVQTLQPHIDHDMKKVYHGFVGAPKKGAKVKISEEHDEYKWVSIKQALALPSKKLSHHARFLLGAMQAEESIKGTKIVKQPGPDGKNCGNCAHYCSKTNTCHLWSKKKGSKVFVLPDWFCQGYAAMPLPNPLPKPRKKNGRKEPSKKFVDRMMGNTKMRAEFPDAGQRYAVTLRLVEKYYGKAARKKIAPRDNGLFSRAKIAHAIGKDSNGMNFESSKNRSYLAGTNVYEEYPPSTIISDKKVEIRYRGEHPSWIEVDTGNGPQRYQGPILEFTLDRKSGKIEAKQGSIPKSQIMSMSERQAKIDALGPRPSPVDDPRGFNRHLEESIRIKQEGRVNPSDILPIYSGEPKGMTKNLGAVFAEIQVGRNIFADIGEGVQDIYRGLVGGRQSATEKRMAMAIAEMQKELSDRGKALGGNAIGNLKVDYEWPAQAGDITLIATADAIKMRSPPKKNPAPSKKLKRAKDKYKKFHGGKEPVSVKTEKIDVGDVWYALGPCWSIGYMSPKETGDDEQKYIHHTNEDSKDGNFPMMYATMPENGEPMIVIKGGSMKIGMRDGLAWLID